MLWHHSQGMNQLEARTLCCLLLQRDVLPYGICDLLVELYTKKMFELLLWAYSTVNIEDTALLLGMNDDDATNSSQMLTVKNQSLVTEQKLDPSKLLQILKIPKYACFTG
ncbi:COP9 signalosome complex subunit 8 [Camellia lanceoleosa]|uniref:COP9 signalosome complex subunit 8 n=1 Tax=Camellia lanceoleosa TaxID=1840588 RepID=A0ACC0ISC7_9ERIC|nr:COP9 signalosome complex subunit 8 [Camellia lanceoleosa]